MPHDWYASLSVQEIGKSVLGGPCDAPVLASPTFVASATGGFEKKVDTRDFTPQIIQSVYQFSPGDAARMLDSYRRNSATECKNALGSASFTVRRADVTSLGDESIAIDYVNDHATCGTINIKLVLVRVGEVVLRVEHNDACDASDSMLAQKVAESLVSWLGDVRQRYDPSLTPDPAKDDALNSVLLTVQDLPSSWSSGLRGERQLTGFGFCGDDVDRGRSLASAMASFHEFPVATGNDSRTELDRLVESPEVDQELAFIPGGGVDAYAADWIESAESCARYYSNTPRVQESLARVELPEAGDGAVAYQQSGFFDGSIRVLVKRGQFVLEIAFRARKPQEPDQALLEDVLRRAEEKLAQSESNLLGEFKSGSYPEH